MLKKRLLRNLVPRVSLSPPPEVGSFVGFPPTQMVVKISGLKSHHRLQHKRSVVCTLMGRAKKNPLRRKHHRKPNACYKLYPQTTILPFSPQGSPVEHRKRNKCFGCWPINNYYICCIFLIVIRKNSRDAVSNLHI